MKSFTHTIKKVQRSKLKNSCQANKLASRQAKKLQSWRAGQLSSLQAIRNLDFGIWIFRFYRLNPSDTNGFAVAKNPRILESFLVTF